MQNMSEEMLGLTIVLVVLVVCFLMMGLVLAMYILQSLGLYQIADRRRIANPWLAWLPIGNLWIFGSIVDHQSRLRGEDRKWRILLPVLDVIAYVGLMLVYIFMIAVVIILGIETADGSDPRVETMLGFFIGLFVLYFVLMLVVTAVTSCQMVCFYKIYEELVPEKALKYFLLSILVPLAGGICLMKCAKSPIGVPLDPIYQNPFEMPAEAP